MYDMKGYHDMYVLAARYARNVAALACMMCCGSLRSQRGCACLPDVLWLATLATWLRLPA